MNFLDNSLNIFQKGEFVLINSDFITAAVATMAPINEIQAKYFKTDTDTFINEVRDSLVSRYLGFDYVNIKKHGFDAKKSNIDEYIEVKQTSFTSKRWGGTFNDTNLEKAEAFKDKKLFLAVAIWEGMTDLIAIVYGQNPEIGHFLEGRVRAVANSSTRSTQNISVDKLLKDYGFKVIIPPGKSVAEVRNIFIAKSSAFRSLRSDTFVEYDKFLDTSESHANA